VRRLLALPLALAVACRAAPIANVAPGLSPNVERGASGAPIELVETAPVETTLDHADLPEAFEIWRSMVDGAERSLDFAEFYASDEPGSRLEGVVESVERAAARGVRVRFLADSKMAQTYPATLDRLAAHGADVRHFDVGTRMGGVLHAKYFLVDGREAFLGSQNFDWRSLEHIQELGVRVRDAEAVRELGSVFAMDWALAGGGTKPEPVSAASTVAHGPIEFVASPRDWLPPGVEWDLPHLVALIDGAERTVCVQLLTYRADLEGERAFRDLEDALLRAAARGVRVRLLLADWCKRASTIGGLQRIEPVANLEVRLVTIPPSSRGFIPFARVIHSKYLAVDARDAWVGTSNWERDYFFRSRNVGVVLHEPALAGRLERFFEDGWTSTYATPVDPKARYAPPAISAAGDAR